MLAAVVAMPDERWGEVPCAFVELKPRRRQSEAGDHRVLPHAAGALQVSEAGGVRSAAQDLDRQDPEVRAAQPGQVGQRDRVRLPLKHTNKQRRQSEKNRAYPLADEARQPLPPQVLLWCPQPSSSSTATTSPWPALATLDLPKQMGSTRRPQAAYGGSALFGMMFGAIGLGTLSGPDRAPLDGDLRVPCSASSLRRPMTAEPISFQRDALHRRSGTRRRDAQHRRPDDRVRPQERSAA